VNIAVDKNTLRVEGVEKSSQTFNDFDSINSQNSTLNRFNSTLNNQYQPME
jgi:hypothetical protein